MKRSEIEVGGIYFDGKAGVRRIIGEGGKFRTFSGQTDCDCVEYEVLAARAHRRRRGVSTRSSKASWARERVPERDLPGLLLRLQAAAMRLPPQLRAFFSTFTQAAWEGERQVRCDAAKYRLVRMALQRGLVEDVIRSRDGVNATITYLGAVYLAYHGAATAPQSAIGEV
ncbi:MAG TPA: hypothetical protein VF178_04190 [Gemmatimonadaceae bacterium]